MITPHLTQQVVKTIQIKLMLTTHGPDDIDSHGEPVRAVGQTGALSPQHTQPFE